MNNYLSQIIYLTKKEKYKVPFLILVILFISLFDILGLGLIAPYIAILTDQNNTYLEVFKNLLSNFNVYLDSYQTILLISILLLLVFFFKTIGNILLNFILLRLIHKKEVEIRFELIKSYYNRKYELMISNRSSDSIENIVSLVPQFLFHALYPLLKIISNIIIVSLISVFLFFVIGKFIFFLILFLSLVIFVYDSLFGGKLISYGKKSSQGSRSIIKGIQETLNGLKEIKILDKEKFFTNQILAGAIEYAKYKVRLTIISTSFPYIFEFLVILLVTLFVIIHISYVGYDFISILPTLGVLALAILRLIPKAVMISSDIGKIRSGRYATNQVYDIYKLINNEKKQSRIKTVIDESFNSLRLSDVSYKYPETEKNVINKINLEIKKGDHIGIRGESGSGKTTFVDLITGHLNPNQGKIYFNSTLLDDKNYHNFISLISYIPQKIFLIDDTLKKNITLCDDSEIDQTKLIRSIAKAKIDDLVNNLDLGIETKVGEDGATLSGGQRQRIAIARSFYHDKEFIIFDEVTSALDAKTSSQIIKEISLLKENTVITISHNHETIKNCNRIFEIKNGNLGIIK